MGCGADDTLGAFADFFGFFASFLIFLFAILYYFLFDFRFLEMIRDDTMRVLLL